MTGSTNKFSESNDHTNLQEDQNEENVDISNADL